MNLLFVCSRNQWRSPTAERIFRDYPDICARSAGTSRQAKKYLTADDITWADKIFVMEDKHKSQLTARFANQTRYKAVIVLDIADDYNYMDSELVEILTQSVEPYLLSPN